MHHDIYSGLLVLYAGAGCHDPGFRGHGNSGPDKQYALCGLCLNIKHDPWGYQLYLDGAGRLCQLYAKPDNCSIFRG
jgi:hypothetical protein